MYDESILRFENNCDDSHENQQLVHLSNQCISHTDIPKSNKDSSYFVRVKLCLAFLGRKLCKSTAKANVKANKRHNFNIVPTSRHAHYLENLTLLSKYITYTI